MSVGCVTQSLTVHVIAYAAKEVSESVRERSDAGGAEGEGVLHAPTCDIDGRRLRHTARSAELSRVDLFGEPIALGLGVRLLLRLPLLHLLLRNQT
jgi:hypothetical protein